MSGLILRGFLRVSVRLTRSLRCFSVRPARSFRRDAVRRLLRRSLFNNHAYDS